ncbi:MAG: aspartate carbamoyltransferase [Gammaproteobacteria bacterium]|nr:aspartate carbamoyltransferase [Gammaproteobacteria bacterium]
MLSVACPAQAAEPASGQRLDEVAGRGAQVMPFSLERTTHVFTKTDRGGVQQVLAKDDGDQAQIALIREHLSKIAREFRRGNFSDPAWIHGDGMPGLAALRVARPGEIEIIYKELPAGAEIDYSSGDAKLVTAIHEWFDAQLSDHAHHAVPGHDHHPQFQH